MKQAFVIPVELGLNKETITQLKTNLQAIAANAKGIFTAEQQSSAANLVATIEKQIQAYDQLSSSGKMNNDKVKALMSTFDATADRARSLAHSLDDAFDLEKVLTAEDKAKLNDLDKQFIKLEEDYKDLEKEIETSNVAQVLSSIGLSAEDVNLGKNIKVLNTGLKQLQTTKTEIETAQAAVKGKRGSEAQETRDRLKNEKKQVEQAIAAITKQMTVEDDAAKNREVQLAKNKQGQKDVKTQIDQTKKAAIDKAKAEVEGVKQSVKELKTQKEILEQNEKLQSLSSRLNPFAGLGTGIKTGLTNFIEGIASGILIINGLKRILRETITTIKELDTAFNEIAMVTTYTTEEVWQMKNAFVDIATTTGQSVVEVTKLAGEFFRQGRSLSETLKLTEAAGIAAKVAGISAGDSVNYLTSAINGYRLSADQAMAVSDKFAALAASSATDYEELAIALSKVAAQAYSAGVDMDNMMGFIAKALEVTREAPENIGTAFKTIFARMSELKDFGKTLEDGMDVNRIDKALATIGVALTDENRELRDLDTVLIDVGHKWSSLTKNQKAYIATALAGTRQQTRLLAVFEDFDRTMELTEVSANSLGATFAQQEKYYSSIAYAQNKLTVAWQNFLTNLGSSQIFIAFYEVLAGIVESLGSVASAASGLGSLFPILTLATIILSIVISKLTKELYSNAVSAALDAGATTEDAIATGLATVAKEGLAFAIGKVSLAFKQLFAAMGPPGLVILGITVAVTALAFAFNSATQKNQKFVESMRSIQAKVFNYRKKADELEGLVEEYEAIENSINRTNEDLEKQKQLTSQIQDLMGEESALDLTGSFNINVVKDKIAELRKEADTTFNDATTKAIITYGTLEKAYLETTDTIIRQQLLIQNAINEGVISSYSEFLDLETDKRKELLATQALQLDALKYLNKIVLKDGPVQNTTIAVTEIDEVKLQEAKDKLASLFEQDFSNSNLNKQLEILDSMKFDGWSQDIQDALASTSPELQNIISLMERLNTDTIFTLKQIISQTTLTESQIYKLNDAIESLGLVDTQANELFTNLLKSESNTFKTIAEFASKYNKNIFDALDITRQLKDALDTISIESLSNELGSLRSVYSNLDKVNNMISGDAEYDLAFMNEMIQMYPEIGDAILANKELSLSSIQAIAEEEKDNFIANIDREIKSLETDYKMNELKIKALQDLAKDEATLNDAMAKYNIDVTTASYSEIFNAYRNFLLLKAKADNESIKAKQLKELELSELTPTEKLAEQNRIIGISDSLTAALSNIIEVQDEAQVGVDSFVNRINGEITSLENTNKTIKASIANLTYLKNNIDKVTAATKADTDAAEDYKEALNEIVILTEQLAAMDEELSKYKFMEEHAKTGKEYLEAIYSQNAALDVQNDLLEDTIDAQKRQQSSIYDSLGVLKKYVSIVNGRMIVSMSNYINISDDQQKIIDEAVDSFNELSGSISDNSNTLNENTAAIEENLQKIEDKTVELYDTLKEAIISEEETKLEIIKEGIEEEKKLLDERKQMYEDAFAEEDYTNALNSITEKRTTVIEKLSALEGATDLASLKRREELLKEKVDLDKEYNTKVTEYNREALLTTLEDEQTTLEDKQAAYEAQHEERVNSVTWLENRIKEIMNQGLDATIAYLQTNLPEYQDAWSMTKDNIETEWTTLFDIVNATVQEISNNIPDFSGMIAQLKAAADYVAAINTTKYTPTPDLDQDPVTKTKTVWIYNGKEYSSQLSAKNVKKMDETAALNHYNSMNAVAKSTGSSTMQKVAEEYLAAYRKILNSTITSKVVSAKTGGLVDYTGLAMLHGSSTKPERVLSPVQTELFDNMVAHLESLSTNSGSVLNPSSNISIENITIQTPQLNTGADFRSAGQDLAKEIITAITERGLSINKKR